MQITVAYVNQPKQGYSFGSIKGTNGAYYNVNGEDLPRYRTGMTFDVQPEEKTSKQGKVYLWMPKGFDPGATPSPQVNMAPAAGGPNGQAIAGGAKDVCIVAQVLLKGFLATGQFGLTDLPALETACVQSAKRIVDACK